MNKVVLVGNLTRDPELSETASGVSFCKFSIAVNRTYANANGEREVDFLNIIAWRGIAENCGKYLIKGSKVAVSGSIQTRSYEDKNGDKRYVTEVVAEDVEFLSTKDKQGAEGQAAPSKSNKQTSMGELKPVDDDEDLPF